MKRIFWDYKRSFMGMPFVPLLAKKVVIPPVVIFTSLITLQYFMTSNIYYDQYSGDASQYRKQ